MMVRSLLRNYGAQAMQQAVSAWTSHSKQQHEQRAELPCTAVVICALPIETGGIIDLLQQRLDTRCGRFQQYDGLVGERRVIVAEAGEGVKAASEATADLLALHDPAWVLAAGFSAALQGELHRGDIVVGTELVDDFSNLLSIPMEMTEAPGLRIGRLLTLDDRLESSVQKKEAGQKHQALAYDHETMAIAQACRHAKTRLMVVRVINETLLQETPLEWESVAGQEHFSGKLGAAAGALWQRPSMVKDWWTIKNHAIQDSDRLGKFLLGMIQQLP